MTLITVLQLLVAGVYAQNSTGTHSFLLSIVNERKQPIDGATVKLLQHNNTLKTAVTNANGAVQFNSLAAGDYTFSITYTGYQPKISRTYRIPAEGRDSISLQPSNTALQEVSITAKTPMVIHQQGKVVLDVAASVSNTGLTLLEVLERSPGVSVDKNGGIALQGKAGVLVMIDDKPTYLSGGDLNNLLSSMSATQVSQIELIANPTAKYDASGNAGIINIKTKKSKVKGFNGSFTTSLGQGHYPKNTNSLVLNYRTGKVNAFFNYSLNYVKYYTDLYALRKYYDANGGVTATLNQTSWLPGTSLNNTIKTGMDYYITPKTTIGLVLTGTAVHRTGGNNAKATWLDADNMVDSAIVTTNSSTNRFKNGAVNANLRSSLAANQDIAVDLDYLNYNIPVEQTFKNQLLAPGGYTEISRGTIPTKINISSGKADYTLRLKKDATLQAGWKSSFTNTDNLASYQNLIGNQYVEDNSKNNHFIYKENIHAAYASLEKKFSKVTTQFGLRYEHTGYDANQLGNATHKDSSFSRNYGELFPSGYVSYQADTANSFTLTAGRRIDRPIFQNLNPFYFIINKYTYNTGNPFLLPQFSWNFELSHQYKNLLTTTVSYSKIQNYFSQIFLSDASDPAILLYTQGNVGGVYNLGVSEAVSVSPVSWWAVTAQAIFNHKQLKGFNGNTYTTEISQLNLNAVNQFTLGKGYVGEISGFYTTRARNDIQEVTYPTGQLSVGLSKPVLNKKGTLKLTARDLFYTNAMEGFTTFPNATEYFMLRRDTRVVTLSFTYRFGKTFKTAKRTGGSAADEMERVGNG